MPSNHPAAKGGRQKGIGKKVTKNIKKVTKWSPKGDQNRKSDLSPFAAQWSNLVPSTFLKSFSGDKGVSLVRSLCTRWEALLNKNLAIQTCLRGCYQVRILGASGRDQGGTWYGNSAKPERHFAKGIFGKLFPVTRVRSPTELVQMIFFLGMEIFGWIWVF